MKERSRTRRLASLALLTSLILILQAACTVLLHLGLFPVTLALIPIVVGAAMYGPAAGAYLGGVFGVVVFLTAVLGLDPNGYVLFSARPLMTAVLDLLKGVLAGGVSGLVYAALGRKAPVAGGIAASLAAPVVNTGVFAVGLALFYPEVLRQWGGGSNLVYGAVLLIVGVNFFFELVANAVLSTVVIRVLGIYPRRNPHR